MEGSPNVNVTKQKWQILLSKAVNQGGRGVKKAPKSVNAVCEQTLCKSVHISNYTRGKKNTHPIRKWDSFERIKLILKILPVLWIGISLFIRSVRYFQRCTVSLCLAMGLQRYRLSNFYGDPIWGHPLKMSKFRGEWDSGNSDFSI